MLIVRSCTVTASQAELDMKMKEANEIYYGIDILVNNAGYFEIGLVEEVRYVTPLASYLWAQLC
jgi:NADP-dependent 3-hydroxy acid dehydrogenase YdfG